MTMTNYIQTEYLARLSKKRESVDEVEFVNIPTIGLQGIIAQVTDSVDRVD